jgi:hypothetical protein
VTTKNGGKYYTFKAYVNSPDVIEIGLYLNYGDGTTGFAHDTFDLYTYTIELTFPEKYYSPGTHTVYISGGYGTYVDTFGQGEKPISDIQVEPRVITVT